jgi:spore coat protein A, manganese oxidase
MAERYEVVIDFEKYAIGDKIILQNLGPANNEDFPSTKQVMRFDVVREASDRTNNSVPADLDPENEVMALTESDATPETRRQPRQLNVVRQGGHWTVNGKTWDDVIASGFKDVFGLNPQLGAVEIWEVNNNSGGWFHPVHIHLIDFKVLERDGQPAHPYERGPKDTIYAGEGEHIRVIARFGPQVGRYMVHCHNLVHEDHDMMVQFEVGQGGDDPIKADPAKPLPEGPLTEDP